MCLNKPRLYFDAWMAELPSFVDLGCEYGEFADWTVGNLPNHSLVVPDAGCCPTRWFKSPVVASPIVSQNTIALPKIVEATDPFLN